MIDKNIVTSCPLPLIKLNVALKYAEVKKPSGVGYILLALIKDARGKNEKVIDVLTKFGVPTDLHFIFADEIAILVERKILHLVTENEYQKEYLSEYTISNFAFTKDGERMFREGAIPTGEEKIKQVVVFFNPLTSKYSLSAPQFMPMEKSDCYSNDFMDRVEKDLSGAKEFLIENSTKVGLDKHEHILDVKIEHEEYVVTKSDGNMNLSINLNEIEVSFKEIEEEKFYERYFTSDMLERELAAKTKFKFDDNVKVIKTNKFSSFSNVTNIYLPSEFDNQLKRPVELLIKKNEGKTVIKKGSSVVLLANDSILENTVNGLSKGWSFLTIDSKEARCYTAAKVEINEIVLNKNVSVKLLVEESIVEDQREILYSAIVLECLNAKFSGDFCDIVKVVTKVSKNTIYATQYVSTKLGENADFSYQVDTINTANNFFESDDWIVFVEDNSNAIYDRLISDINKENATYTVSLIKKLPLKHLNLFLEVSSRLEEIIKDRVELFNTLVDAGFTENETLSAVNIIKIYATAVLEEKSILTSVIADKFESLSNNLKNLKNNLGVTSTTKYAFKENYDIDKFIDDFKAYKEKLQGLKKYVGFAQNEFDKLGRYEEIMQPVFDYIMIERNASRNPRSITQKYINQTIASGNYRTAIGDMVIGLDYILSELLDEKLGLTNVFDKIENAKKKKIISVSSADSLHKLRQFRNSLQHPTEKQIIYNKSQMDLWAEIVFEIGKSKGDKK